MATAAGVTLGVVCGGAVAVVLCCRGGGGGGGARSRPGGEAGGAKAGGTAKPSSAQMLATASSAAAPGTQHECRIPCDACETGSIGFLIYIPKGYSSTGTPWPVLYHLHGGGESELQEGFGPPLTEDGVNRLSAVKAHGLPAIAEGSAPACIVVSPQCPKQTAGRGWGTSTSLAALEQLAETVSEGLNVDTARQYLTGLSMGGHGTWSLERSWANASPKRFAALRCARPSLRWLERGRHARRRRNQ